MLMPESMHEGDGMTCTAKKKLVAKTPPLDTQIYAFHFYHDPQAYAQCS